MNVQGYNNNLMHDWGFAPQLGAIAVGWPWAK